MSKLKFINFQFKFNYMLATANIIILTKQVSLNWIPIENFVFVLVY